MSVNFADAASAYNRAIRGQDPQGLEARDNGAAGGDFSALLRRAAEDAVEVLREGEAQSLNAAAGKADITDVVTAVGQAEITLQTVVAVRDRVIQAYQEILRMPI
ncbi:MAG: flagellar hook-basal body complex protein FliE [Rhodospirillales bacterium]|nr:flagellar hook-basal body complex protein FliE [Rhodospirillales bacterium]